MLNNIKYGMNCQSYRYRIFKVYPYVLSDLSPHAFKGVVFQVSVNISSLIAIMQV